MVIVLIQINSYGIIKKDIQKKEAKGFKVNISYVC
jgi:hypothetical protein